MSDRLLDVRSTARILDISIQTVYRLISKGMLPALRMGAKKGYRVKKTDLDNFRRQRKECF